VPRASPRGSPRSASPDGEIGFTRPWSRSPTESSLPPGCPALRPGPAPTRFLSSPLRRHHPDQPHDAAVHPVPLRFRSQVFSTSQRFPGTSGLRGLVSCRCRPWGSPYRALLLARIACASRRRLLPCSSPPPYLRCGARDRIPRVSPTPALMTRWPGSPPRLGRRFWPFTPSALAPEARTLHALSRVGLRGLPDDLDHEHRSHPVPATSAASKLSSPRESVRTAPRFREHTVADALLGFAPPEP
jgi:hypothetical protein